MSKDLLRDSLVPLGSVSSEGPVLVVGAARGGTSMVAGVLHHLGVFLGKEAVPPVYESIPESEILLGRSRRKAAALVAELNAAHGLWAWKRPESIEHLPMVVERLKPRGLLAVFRDPLATASRRSLSSGAFNTHDRDVMTEHLLKVLSEYQQVTEYLADSNLPTALISYDTALTHRAEFVNQLISFLSLNCTDEQIAHAVQFIKPSPLSYRRGTRGTGYRGSLDSATTTFAGGWVDNSESNEIVSVEIFVDDVLAGTIEASGSRADLTAKGLGNCAFHFAFNPPLNTGQVVRARAVGDTMDLPRSPQVVN